MSPRITWSRPEPFGAWVRIDDAPLLAEGRALADHLGVPRAEAAGQRGGGFGSAAPAWLRPLDLHSAVTLEAVCTPYRTGRADVPEDYQGDCRKPTCDASGGVMEVPEPGDEPAEEAGDCKKNICNAAGYPDTMPADDPPVDTTCQTFTCQNGQAVGAPINEGMNCSPHGLVCGSSGACDTCPKPDFACTDNGPASQSHSVATAYDLGKIGDCDSDGYLFCGLLEQGEVEYFSYIATGDGFLCENDPFVSVSSATSVKLCEYFSCPSVTCPSGSVAATLNGMPGCCAEGVYPSMAIDPSCTAPQVVISVESTLPFCAGYKLDFHH